MDDVDDAYAFRATYEPMRDGLKLCIDNVNEEDMRAFSFHPGVKELVICGDFLDHLVVPDGVEWVYACNLALKTIHVPDSVVFLACDGNCLRALELPAGIEDVDAHDNCLRMLAFRGPPTRLESLNLRDNRLMAGLDFIVPPTLYHIELHHSGVTWANAGPDLHAFLLQYPFELGSSLHQDNI